MSLTLDRLTQVSYQKLIKTFCSVYKQLVYLVEEDSLFTEQVTMARVHSGIVKQARTRKKKQEKKR